MSSGLDLRKRGKRRDLKSKGRQNEQAGPMSAIDAGSPGEVRISTDAMIALSHLYSQSPSIQAARTILLGQLLSSGLVVRRDGKDVELKATFSRHIEDVWLPFARGIIDGFLQFGFVVVSLEEEDDAPFANLTKGKKMAAVSNMANDTNEPGDASAARKRKMPLANDVSKSKKDIAEKKRATNLIPVIPDLGQVDVSFIHTGITNYKRRYRIFVHDSDSVYRQDYSSEVFFKSHPDAAGNIVSPIATVFQSASFISSLEELALQAEVVRARQMLVTQGLNRSLEPQIPNPKPLNSLNSFKLLELLKLFKLLKLLKMPMGRLLVSRCGPHPQQPESRPRLAVLRQRVAGRSGLGDGRGRRGPRSVAGNAGKADGDDQQNADDGPERRRARWQLRVWRCGARAASRCADAVRGAGQAADRAGRAAARGAVGSGRSDARGQRSQCADDSNHTRTRAHTHSPTRMRRVRSRGCDGGKYNLNSIHPFIFLTAFSSRAGSGECDL